MPNEQKKCDNCKWDGEKYDIENGDIIMTNDDGSCAKCGRYRNHWNPTPNKGMKNNTQENEGMKNSTNFTPEKIDIDEVIGMIEGMMVNTPDEVAELNKDLPSTIQTQAYHNAIGYTDALSSLKQKLEARNTKIWHQKM